MFLPWLAVRAFAAAASYANWMVRHACCQASRAAAGQTIVADDGGPLAQADGCRRTHNLVAEQSVLGSPANPFTDLRNKICQNQTSCDCTAARFSRGPAFGSFVTARDRNVVRAPGRNQAPRKDNVSHSVLTA